MTIIAGHPAPSRSDLSLTVTSTAAGFAGSGEPPFPAGVKSRRQMSRGEFAEPGAKGRAADLYVVDLPVDLTMMQPCASVAKLRGGGPILDCGSKTM